MKRLDELGISQTPWEICDWCAGHISIASKSGWRVCETRESADARLIAAAPKLYEALHGLLEIVCDDCKSRYNGTDGKCLVCPRVAKARAALAEAAGESEVKNV